MVVIIVSLVGNVPSGDFRKSLFGLVIPSEDSIGVFNASDSNMSIISAHLDKVYRSVCNTWNPCALDELSGIVIVWINYCDSSCGNGGTTVTHALSFLPINFPLYPLIRKWGAIVHFFSETCRICAKICAELLRPKPQMSLKTTYFIDIVHAQHPECPLGWKGWVPTTDSQQPQKEYNHSAPFPPTKQPTKSW